MSNVESLTYQSKTAIKEEMRKENEVFNEVMSTWSEEDNPLKDTFQVKVKAVEKIADTAKRIEKLDKVSTVRYGEGMVDNLIVAFEAAQKVSYGMVIALILVTVFLIINTIKLTIFSRKREISIIKTRQETMQETIDTIQQRQRIDGINIARILEKQNETFAMLNKNQYSNTGNLTELKLLK